MRRPEPILKNSPLPHENSFPIYLALVPRLSVATMIFMKFKQVLIASATLMLGMSMNACSFRHREPEVGSLSSSQEFDPYTNTWKTATHVVPATPSEPNQTLAQQAELKKSENSIANKMSRSAASVGTTLKKPLQWLPWTKKSEDATVQ